ncbi:MAG: PAS domain-containing protein [Actinomycetia bacterium]|nr:PAS domain-containing protein [Actinomycetes bacterium]
MNAPRRDWVVPLGLAVLATAALAVNQGSAPDGWVILAVAWIWAIRAAVRAHRYARVLADNVTLLFETVERWAGGDLSARVYLDADDPLDALAHGMNRVAEVLAERTRDLTEDKERLEAIVGSMANGILIVDRALYVTLINRAAQLIFRLGDQEVVGRHVLEVIRATAIENALQQVTRNGTPVVVEWAPDPNEDTLIECSMAPVGQPGGGYGAVLVARDITLQRRTDRMRADFVANVSHELQTPLTTIIGFTEALVDDVPPPPDQARRFLELIHSEAVRLSRLVDDLLALSRLEHHSVPVRREPVDLRALADQVALQMTTRAAAAGLSLTTAGPAGVRVWGDPDLLKEVLLNLVSNAIQYTPAGGRVTVTTSLAGGYGRWEVEDTGIGIPAADLPRIFERFYRVDKDRSRRSGGTGLGLAIVKHILELLDGRVFVQSEPGRGSRFTVELPAVQESG